MRGSKKIFSLFFIAAISFSCATLKPQLKPHVIKKNLENKTKDEVFINCIKALKKKKYIITSLSKEKGFIQTHWNYFRKKGNSYRLKLSIHILENNFVSTIVSVKADYQGEVRFIGSQSGLPVGIEVGREASGWKDISADEDLVQYLDDFFLEVQRQPALSKDELSLKNIYEIQKDTSIIKKPSSQISEEAEARERFPFLKRLGFRLDSGYSHLNVGDLNTWIESWNNSLALPEKFEKLHNGLGFDGEILLDITSKWAVAFSVEQIFMKNKSYSIHVDSSNNEIKHNLTNEVKAIPLKAGAYYSIPFANKIKFFLNAGVGYYFTQVYQDYHYHANNNYWVNWQKDMSSSGFGLHGGIGMEYKFKDFLSFFMECRGIYAKVDGFEGVRKYESSSGYKYTEEGTFYIWEQLENWSQVILNDETEESTYRIMPGEPLSVWTRRNIREFILDLSGVTFRVGIKLKIF